VGTLHVQKIVYGATARMTLDMWEYCTNTRSDMWERCTKALCFVRILWKKEGFRVDNSG